MKNNYFWFFQQKIKLKNCIFQNYISRLNDHSSSRVFLIFIKLDFQKKFYINLYLSGYCVIYSIFNFQKFS